MLNIYIDNDLNNVDVLLHLDCFEIAERKIDEVLIKVKNHLGLYCNIYALKEFVRNRMKDSALEMIKIIKEI